MSAPLAYPLLTLGRAASLPFVFGGPAPWGPFATELEAHESARAALREALPTMPPAAWQVLQAIGWAESRYGVPPSWQNADGSPSWNWGAVVAGKGQPSIDHGDHDATGKPIVQRFASYPSQAAGLARFLGIMRTDAIAAAGTGNATRTAQLMFDRRYYTGVAGSREERILGYANMIRGAAAYVAGKLGEPLYAFVTSDVPAPSPGSSPPFLGAPAASGMGVGGAVGVVLVGLGLAWVATR